MFWVTVTVAVSPGLSVVLVLVVGIVMATWPLRYRKYNEDSLLSLASKTTELL